MGKRVLYWDVIKCFAIFMVVWGHTIEMLQLDMSKVWNDIIASIIISFHMPLFMMVSGYFCTFSNVLMVAQCILAMKIIRLNKYTRLILLGEK